MEEGRWKEKLLEGEKELSLLERSGEDYQAALAAAQKLAEYRERMRALGLELESYNRGLGKLEKAREAYKKADEKRRLADGAYRELYQRFLDNQAGILANELAEGVPCPVCGSTVHPAPACRREGTGEVTKEQVDRAQAAAKKEAGTAEALSLEAGTMAGSLENHYARMREQIDREVGTWKEAWKEKLSEAEGTSGECFLAVWGEMLENLKVQLEIQERKALGEADRRAKEMERKRELEAGKPSVKRSAEQAGQKTLEARELLIQAQTRLEELERQIQDTAGKLPFQDRESACRKLDELRRRQREREEAFKAAQDRYESVNRMAGDARAKLETLKRRLEAEEDRLDYGSGTGEDADSFGEELTADREELGRRREAVKAKARQLILRQQEVKAGLETLEESKNMVHHRLETNRMVKTNILKQKGSMEAQQQQWTWVKGLSDTASGDVSGKEKLTLETYVQTAYFERIIARANTRFMVMSGGQYELKRCAEEDNRGKSGLGLNVIDHYNGTERSVKTLSGGESFQASLSLALGLSDEIQAQAGGIRLDTMFVDEGFGSLDEETLNLAVKALGDLAEGRRLVGIISHVSELKTRIGRQIVVVKDRSGGSRADIQLL